MDNVRLRDFAALRPGDHSASNAQAPQNARRLSASPSLDHLSRTSSIRIRRLPSSIAAQQATPTPAQTGPSSHESRNDEEPTRRSRSFSAPHRYDIPVDIGANLARQNTIDGGRMPAIREGESAAHQGERTRLEKPLPPTPTSRNDQPASPSSGTWRLQKPWPASLARAGTLPATSRRTEETAAGGLAERPQSSGPARMASMLGLSRLRSGSVANPEPGQLATPAQDAGHEEYSSEVIDLLDLVDPEVRTMSTLTNLQNSLFVPDLGNLVDRRPAYDLTRRRGSRPAPVRPDTGSPKRGDTRASNQDESGRLKPPGSEQAAVESGPIDQSDARSEAGVSITSKLSDSRYAVLPHGVSLEGWSDADIAELNDHVRHLLHSRREGFRRGLQGFKKYVRRPLGLFVTVYAVLLTLFGAAWVLFLIGWIYVGSRQSYFINVVDNILVALFALVGDGMAPFRVVDTYHMCFIAHYHQLSWRLRREKQMPDLVDHNDLPSRRASAADIADMIDREETAQVSVLTPRQQQRLQYHQAKFNKSHTFYKPHETSTHHAFPLRLLIAVVVLLDCHSLFQIALGTCTWSIDYQHRPKGLTETILSCSISCNIAAGVLISIGDHKTRKKDVLERIHRQQITEEALKRMAKKHTRGEMGISINPNRVESEDIKGAVREATGVDPDAAELPNTQIPAITTETYHTPKDERTQSTAEMYRGT